MACDWFDITQNLKIIFSVRNPKPFPEKKTRENLKFVCGEYYLNNTGTFPRKGGWGSLKLLFKILVGPSRFASNASATFIIS